jgi:two-component system, NtrC family, sensor histidine kinase HydH
MQERNRTTQIAGILGSIGVISVLYYLARSLPPLYQELSTRLYYFPIFLGGLWYGFRGGLRVSLLVSVICLPRVLMGLRSNPALFYDEFLEIFLFNLFGPIWGALADRERRQKALNQELRTLAVLGEAASSLAHEMKNRVVPIRGFVQRIRKNQTLDKETTSYLELVERESGRLEDMTQNMLSFAHHAPLEMKEVDVSLLLEEVRQTLHEPFRNKGVRLVCHCEGHAHRIKLDQERTKEALVNLLYNALHASSEGKEVRILAHRDGASLCIRVEDEGTGIAHEYADKIFLAFFTTKPKGTGLGLAITKRIVEKHGGRIRVVSAPGKGTSVLLDFPISPGTPEPNPAPCVRLEEKE